MKKIFTIAVLAALAAGCSDDDNAPSIDMSQLYKKWYYVSVTVDGKTTQDHPLHPCGQDYIEFKANGTVIMTGYRCADASSYTITSPYEVQPDNMINTMLWGLSGPTALKKLTEKTLKVQYMYDNDADGDEELVTRVYTSIAE